MSEIKVLAFAGSLRKASFNRMLAEASVRLAPKGMTIEHFLLDGLTCFNQDLETDPPDVVRNLREKARAADGILVVSPEYNYSYSSVTKTALDWGSRPHGDSVWEKKPFAIQSASMGGMGGVRAQLHLRQVLGYFEARQLLFPEVFVQKAQDKFDAEGNLTDDGAAEAIRRHLVAFKTLIESIR